MDDGVLAEDEVVPAEDESVLPQDDIVKVQHEVTLAEDVLVLWGAARSGKLVQ